MTERFFDTNILLYLFDRRSPEKRERALILSAAEAVGSRFVYSEDFSHGQSYYGIQVVNPFLEQAH